MGQSVHGAQPIPVVQGLLLVLDSNGFTQPIRLSQAFVRMEQLFLGAQLTKAVPYLPDYQELSL